MATPVVHDGVPVTVRERKNPLKHSEEEPKQRGGAISVIVPRFSETVLIGSRCSVLSLNKHRVPREPGRKI